MKKVLFEMNGSTSSNDQNSQEAPETIKIGKKRLNSQRRKQKRQSCQKNYSAPTEQVIEIEIPQENFKAHSMQAIHGIT